ncbi:histidine kinase [Nocardiopsis dassonvillei]|uniref:sensor histidine kinase n=1 Tax=Nocardiopsis dassonvillei TaxID=2014 RepID=UPI0033C86142
MFGRVRRWSRRHETLVDAVQAAPFLLLCLMASLNHADPDSSGGVPLPVYLALTFALVPPLALRRGYPRTVFAFLALVALLHLAFGLGLILADFAVLIGMYTVAAHCRFRWALVALATAEVGLVLMIASLPHADWGDWNVFVVYTFLIMLLWVTGLYTNVRRGYLVGLEERAEWLERERDARARAAIAEERARIARELHDVVAHNVSVMVVQADGAAFAIDSDPARAKGALETISETGRTALTEMRGMLGVLRDGEPGEEYAPRPGVERLEQLFARVRGAGLPVESTVEGRARQLSAGVDLAVYRVVQESLTNTLKHAGSRVSRVRVRLRYGDDTLEVRVLDDGRGASVPEAARPGRGHGLIGMRERVSVYGGSLRAGPCPGGGYEVVASLPLRPVTA